MVLGVLLLEQPRVHHAMRPVLHQRPDEQGGEKCDQPVGDNEPIRHGSFSTRMLAKLWPRRALVKRHDASRCAEPRCAEPRCAEPRCAEPRCAEPRCAEPRCAEPRCAEPRCAEPRCAEPRCAEPRCAEPQHPDPWSGVAESPIMIEGGHAMARNDGIQSNGIRGNGDIDVGETREWLDALDGVLQSQGTDRARYLLGELRRSAVRHGVEIPFSANTPYINTIPVSRQPPFAGSREIERRIKSLIRWNAMAMVVRANKHEPGIGGHISTYASSAALYEVGFNHFFRGPEAEGGPDFVYFQGHASPGVYARAFLEDRLTALQLEHFRRELAPGGGLSSYPHPWLMPDFWQFPTVSMGLGAIMAIYHARFNRYLHDRGLKDTSKQKVWCFLGDGETDEPESLGSITLASRERLDNLIFVVNCNLQRLDGPVRGNGKIIQELEAAFRGAGWNVIKVIWGSDWDPLLAQDKDGLLVKRMTEAVDGEYQRYSIESGAYIREHFFGKYPELLRLVEHMTDEQLQKLSRGGHDPEKVYAAYKAAVEYKGAPTVILAKTVKGYGLGEAGEGRNITHQQKKLNEEELAEFRTRFNIPISDDEVAEAPFYKPPEDAKEITYLHKARKRLGGYLPSRTVKCPKLAAPADSLIEHFFKGSGDRAASTTMVFVDLLKRLLHDKELGRWIVPIIPDEA